MCCDRFLCFFPLCWRILTSCIPASWCLLLSSCVFLYLHELEKTGEHDKAEGEYLYHFVATLSFSLYRSVTEGQGPVLKVCVCVWCKRVAQPDYFLLREVTLLFSRMIFTTFFQLAHAVRASIQVTPMYRYYLVNWILWKIFFFLRKVLYFFFCVCFDNVFDLAGRPVYKFQGDVPGLAGLTWQ